MKTTVARESEDGLTLCEWEFSFLRTDAAAIHFRLVAFRRWQRDRAGDEYPWPGPPDKWTPFDFLKNNVIQETPEIPGDVEREARYWIAQTITFEEP